MRTIKFRGKTSAGKWVFGTFAEPNMIAVIKEDVICGTPCTSIKGAWVVNPETVGQFTGLHDTNGKEIYEGDIIHVKKCLANAQGVDIIVEWNSRRTMFCYPFVKNRACRLVPYDFSRREHEVIGNIHDNSYLMKGGKE